MNIDNYEITIKWKIHLIVIFFNMSKMRTKYYIDLETLGFLIIN